MIKLLSSAALVLTLSAGSALAMDLGNGFTLNNTITTEYEFNSDSWDMNYSLNLDYQATSQLNLYMTTDIDLLDIDYTGLTIGAEFSPSNMPNITTYLEASFDSNWNSDTVILGVELAF